VGLVDFETYALRLSLSTGNTSLRF